MDTLRCNMDRDFSALDLKMTVKLGSMLSSVPGSFPALRVWAGEALRRRHRLDRRLPHSIHEMPGFAEAREWDPLVLVVVQ